MVMPVGELLRGEVAYVVMRSLLRDAQRELRQLGKPIPNWLTPTLEALAAASELELSDDVRSFIGTATVNLDAVDWITPGEASGRYGITDRYARRLAASGRVHRKRVGSRSWLIDAESLANVLQHTRREAA